MRPEGRLKYDEKKVSKHSLDSNFSDRVGQFAAAILCPGSTGHADDNAWFAAYCGGPGNPDANIRAGPTALV